jgi:hypothetical protein
VILVIAMVLTLVLETTADVAGAAQGPTASPAVVISGASPLPTTCTMPNEFGGHRDQEMAPQMTVDPLDADHIAAVWSQDWADANVVAITRDGGTTWTKAIPPGSTHCDGAAYNSSYNPHVAFGPTGMLFATSYMPDSTHPGSAVAINTSRDGGTTWTPATYLDQAAAPEGVDWSWVATDPADADLVYASWLKWERDLTSLPPNPPRIVAYRMMLARSEDGGDTWSAPITMGAAPSGMLWGPTRIYVLADGTLVNVFTEASTTDSYIYQSPSRILSARSTDRGATWSTPIEVARVPAQHRDADMARAGWPYAGGTAIGPRREIYCAWVELRADRSSLVHLASSTDGGRSWSRPQRIASSTVPILNPNLALAPDGTLGLSFYDLRNDVPGDDTITTDVWFRSSRNSGRTWQETHLAGPFDLSTTLDNLGPNQGLAAGGGRFVAGNAVTAPVAEIGATDIVFSAIEL